MPADRSATETTIGRDADLAALRDRLGSPGAIAVTGPPGIGKTHTLHALAAGWDGEVRWIELHGVTDRESLVVRLAEGLGVPDPAAAKGDAVRHAIRSRPGALVVLDHAESAPEAVGAELGAWVHAVPQVRCVVGSRVRLDGVAAWPLMPLSLDAAAALYLDRARTVHPDVDFPRRDVEALVQALDGLPLAIELAAARVRLYPPEALTARLPAELGDLRRAQRQGTLEAALSASWDHLGGEARDALSAATVLRAPFDVAAFEGVTEAPAEALEALLDASLVALARPGRFRLLETVRAFAAARLDPERRTGLEARHARHVLAVAEPAAADAARSGRWEQVRELGPDLVAVVARGGGDGARAALVLGELRLARGPRVDPTGALDRSAVPEALRVRVACLRSRFLFDAGRGDEALAELDAVAPADATEHLAVAHHRMMHHRVLGHPDQAERWRAEGEAWVGEAEPAVVASFRVAEAVLLARRGERARAAEGLAASQAVTRDAPALEARRLAYLGGLLAMGATTLADGVAQLEHALVLFRQQQDEGWEGSALLWLGGALFDQGHLDPAADALSRAATLVGRAGDTMFESSALEHLAAVRVEQQRWDEVAALHARIAELPPRPTLLSLVQAQQGIVAHFAGDPDAAAVRYEAALAGFVKRGEQALATVYRVYLALADPSRSEAALAAAAADAEGLGLHYPLLVRAGREIVGGGAVPETLEALRGTRRADVRILLALAERAAAVAADGSWFVAAGGHKVELERRPVLRRALAALAEAGPGALVARRALIGKVWPGERMVGDSADARLHSTIRALRRLGLELALRTGDVEGDLAYGLAAGVVVR